MPFISVPVDPTRIAQAIEDQNMILNRIADALDRAYPPVVLPDRHPRRAELSDLRRPSHDTAKQIRDELEVFAQNNNVRMNSEAFLNSIIQYERQVAEAYGQEAVMELPWNKAAGSPLFEGREKSHVDSGKVSSIQNHHAAAADAKSAPGSE